MNILARLRALGSGDVLAGAISAVLLTGLLVAFSSATGCTGTTTTGKRYIIKVNRELRCTVDADLYTTHTTAIDVLSDDLLYTVTHEARDAREGVIRARTARNRGVRVETYKVSDEETTLDVYVSPLGDLSASVDIMNRIVERIAEIPPE